MLGECVDMRKDLCFLSYNNWRCTHPMTQNQTKKVCCCSMGQAWGQPCEPCPLPGSSKYMFKVKKNLNKYFLRRTHWTMWCKTRTNYKSYDE